MPRSHGPCSPESMPRSALAWSSSVKAIPPALQSCPVSPEFVTQDSPRELSPSRLLLRATFRFTRQRPHGLALSRQSACQSLRSFVQSSSHGTVPAA